ncbi:MAG TPA: 3-methyl-2-indolic acid synthase [Rhizomicrobium sp.]|nr:3-methyl-2-indolic acid synthase [Rhizomicrobium sp.]
MDSNEMVRAGDEFISLAGSIPEAQLLDGLGCGFTRPEHAGSKPALALALFRSAIPTDDIYRLAKARVDEISASKETFVPIFLTNHCEADCAMCGMRTSNGELHRKFSGRSVVDEQLRILRDAEHVRGVGFLTGEYADKFTRYVNAFYVGWAINRALSYGFEKVFFNIGSMAPDEIAVLADWLEPGDERITMCVFQETYDLEKYDSVIGRRGRHTPKADFDKRLRSFENWLDAGFKAVNPGFLVGLHDLDQELVRILHHIDGLKARDAKIYVSLPRLRPALGVSNKTKIGDDAYIRLISVIALLYPEAGIVITTREDVEFQDRALPLIRTLSPGSPDVSPYRWEGNAANDVESSQFVIPDHRRPRDILSRLKGNGYDVRYFEHAPRPHPSGELRTAS